MGGHVYSHEERSFRAASSGYTTVSHATMDSVFTQQKEKKAHPSMSPLNMGIRECRDSEIHPEAFPIVFGLDFTGSMHSIPLEMIKTGLPKIMSDLFQKGLKDAAICFLGIGDHECDHYPLQVGQFESGDAQLDMWLTRSYIEGRGGGNYGESYLLAWYAAAFHTATDHWDKRKKKGILVTIGDERTLELLPASSIKEIFGDNVQKDYTAKELLDLVKEKWDVYHITMLNGGGSYKEWDTLLGQHHITQDRNPSKAVDCLSKVIIDNADTILGKVEETEEKVEEVAEKPKSGKNTDVTPPGTMIM